MRDLLIAAIVFIAIPFILARPYVGVLVWSWLGYMNPHRLAYGWAYTFPFSNVVAVATLIGTLFSKEKKTFPWCKTTIIWVLFVVWMNISTLLALNPELAQVKWERAMKIQLIAFVTMLLMNNRMKIDRLVWVVALSIGFFGIKGGVFALITGGNYRVWGPPDSFIYGNNEIALALIMVMPLMRYMQLNLNSKLLSQIAWAVIGLCALSILASRSRGAALAAVAMIAMLWLRSPGKLGLTFGLAIMVPMLLLFMPDSWFERMGTIESYDSDRSALGRINAWWFAFRLALDHPFVGGGFDTFTPELFLKYAPDPNFLQDAHSIYFQVLAEHGFVGLILFLMLGFAAFFAAGDVIRKAKKIAELAWCGRLAAMLQVSMIGFAVGGAFLGLAYFDLYYHLLALCALLQVHARSVYNSTQAVTQVPGTLVTGAPGSLNHLAK